jgi:hypothetical protein
VADACCCCPNNPLDGCVADAPNADPVFAANIKYQKRKKV